jgi:hypothetical protein
MVKEFNGGVVSLGIGLYSFKGSHGVDITQDYDLGLFW